MWKPHFVGYRAVMGGLVIANLFIVTWIVRANWFHSANTAQSRSADSLRVASSSQQTGASRNRIEIGNATELVAWELHLRRKRCSRFRSYAGRSPSEVGSTGGIGEEAACDNWRCDG
jgi:hypothetical protein